jgi:hypothetical protein
MRRHAERPTIAALVIGLHVLLLWGWRVTTQAVMPVPAVEPVPLVVQLLSLERPRARIVPAGEPPPVARASAASPRRLAQGPTLQGERPDATRTVEGPRESTAITLPPPEPAASGPETLDLRLHQPRGTADRGGLTEPTDSMRRLALNDPRSNSRPDPTQVLPNTIAESAKGDCLKGEFFGGGMGLLSAPFLAVAVARGACKPQR